MAMIQKGKTADIVVGDVIQIRVKKVLSKKKRKVNQPGNSPQ